MVVVEVAEVAVVVRGLLGGRVPEGRPLWFATRNRRLSWNRPCQPVDPFRRWG